jgi:hypothetical protein
LLQFQTCTPERLDGTEREDRNWICLGSRHVNRAHQVNTRTRIDHPEPSVDALDIDHYAQPSNRASSAGKALQVEQALLGAGGGRHDFEPFGGELGTQAQLTGRGILVNPALNDQEHRVGQRWRSHCKNEQNDASCE